MVTQSNQPNRANRIALAVAGCLSMAIGVCTIIFVYAFAAMIDPRIIGWNRCLLILRKMLLTPSAVPVLFGVFAIGVGVAVIMFACGISVHGTRKITSITVLMTVLLALAAFMASSM
jgi:uncharacterized membrane protein HdeD (DUF308 family)